MKTTKYTLLTKSRRHSSAKKQIVFLLLMAIVMLLAACSQEASSPELDEVTSQASYACPVKGHHSFGQGWGAGRNHKGVDLLAAKGLPLVAITDGVVVRNRTFSAGGKTTLLKANDGRYYYYAHLDRYVFPQGDNQNHRVSKGQTIGYVGETGNASGPHLHFEKRGGKYQSTAQSDVASFTKNICSGNPQPVSIYNPRVFDWQYYLYVYPDLRNAGLRTKSQAEAHWRDYGIKEDRRGAAEFHAKTYYNRYADLRKAFPSSDRNVRNRQLITHYLTYGIKEGRSGR